MFLRGITSTLVAQQPYDMSYQTFTDYIKEEMTEEEFKSINDYFEGSLSGIVCYYDYGDFSGDSLDEFVMLTSENTFEYGQRINIYIFRGTQKETFEFVDKISFFYWRSRYEVAILIKKGELFITSTDRDYENWTWNAYQISDQSLKLLRKEVYQ
jgi:hypothetical protein